ncbi:MAG TPA: NAD(P)-dependent oxidoreductase [Abditibacteriaceae bacterium]|jgi:nucleoside-diphosphate-sugar epimerase
MKILLTGASGNVGRAVAHELLEHGHTIRAFDRAPLHADLRTPELASRIEMFYGELTDRLAILRAAQGCDTIAHLAAIPNPMQDETQLFPINVTGTQNVFAAAEGNGIARVVLASSCSAYGFAFAREPFDPDYFPIDENHPLRPQDIYGLSKQLNEETARTYARRGIHSVSWRLPGVMNLHRGNIHWRKRHLRVAFEHRNNDFWSYIAREDAALAFRLALESDLEGARVLIANARDVFGRGDVREAIAKHFPHLAESVQHLAPDAPLYSPARAKELLGYEAKISWRDIPELANDDEIEK